MTVPPRNFKQQVAAALRAGTTKAWNVALVTRGTGVSAEVVDQGWQDAALAALRGESA